MKNSFLLFCAVLSLGGAAAFGQETSLGTLVGSEAAAELASQGTIKRVQLKAPKQILVPRDGLGMEIKGEIDSFSPTLMVEVLYIYKKKSGGADGAWTAEQRLAVYNAVRSLSTLSGIEYYSASRKTMRTFYEVSYAIAGPDAKERRPDPQVTDFASLPTAYAFQKDLTFGENIYRYDYKAGSSALSFTQTNLTGMSYGIVPILGKERLRSVVYVTDLGDSLLVYAASAAKATLLPGIEGKVRDSFSNRADAIYKWFSGHMDRIFP